MNKDGSTFGMNTDNENYSSDKMSKSKNTLEMVRERADVEKTLSELFRKSLSSNDNQSTLEMQANQTMLWGINVLLSEFESTDKKERKILHRQMDKIRSILHIYDGYNEESLKEMERALISPFQRTILRDKKQNYLSLNRNTKRALCREAHMDLEMQANDIDMETFIDMMTTRSMKKTAADAKLSQAVDKALAKLFQPKTTHAAPANTAPSSDYSVSSPLNKREKPIKASWKNNMKVFYDDDENGDSNVENGRGHEHLEKKTKWKGKHVVKFRRMTNLYR